MLAVAFDAGVNFFDNAEVYAQGQSELLMGEAIKALKWPRLRYVVSTKFFSGLGRDGNTVNRIDTLHRKYLMQAIDGSLSRLQLDFIDLVFCHRPDPHTPIEETVWAMSDMIASGKALYWGTSEWSAADIRAAWDIADRHHLRKPVMEQPQYHLFHRKRVGGDRRRARRRRRAAGDRVGGEESARLDRDHGRVERRSAAVEPRRRRRRRQAHARSARAHRRDRAASRGLTAARGRRAALRLTGSLPPQALPPRGGAGPVGAALRCRCSRGQRAAFNAASCSGVPTFAQRPR
jgi:aryl-alcohol dehydrogenase-like predicted oxidoreductase